mgnify:CR=1 FL=1
MTEFVAGSPLSKVHDKLAEQGCEIYELEGVVPGFNFTLPGQVSSRKLTVTPFNAEIEDHLSVRGWAPLSSFDGFLNREQNVVVARIRPHDSNYNFSRKLETASAPGTTPRPSTELGEVALANKGEGLAVVIGAARGVVEKLFQWSRNSHHSSTSFVFTVTASPDFPGRLDDDLLVKLADSYAFDLEVKYGASFSLALPPKPTFSRKSPESQSPMRFVSNQYPHELVEFFRTGSNKAISNVIRYWAYYQILEYFFPQVVLHDKKKTVHGLILHPSFDPHSDESLSQLVEVILKRDSETRGEIAQLEAVLKEYVSHEEFLVFLNDSELTSDVEKAFNPMPQSCKSDKIPGTEVNLKKTDLFHSSLARRIYTIRNGIVHSKKLSDAERELNLIPGTSNDLALQSDLQILRYIAELVIVRNSEPLIP